MRKLPRPQRNTNFFPPAEAVSVVKFLIHTYRCLGHDRAPRRIPRTRLADRLTSHADTALANIPKSTSIDLSPTNIQVSTWICSTARSYSP